MISGLLYLEDYITEDTSSEILEWIGPPKTKIIKRYRNRILRYGSNKPYPQKETPPEIPELFRPIQERLFNENIMPEIPNSVTINEYHPGQTITPHIDSRSSGPIIAILSLLGIMSLTLSRKEQRETIVLAPKSLLVLSGESRTDWMHHTEPARNLRYSIVFRCGR